MEEGIGFLFITSLYLFKLYTCIILIKIKIELKGKHKKEWKINGSCFPKLNLIMENWHILTGCFLWWESIPEKLEEFLKFQVSIRHLGIHL